MKAWRFLYALFFGCFHSKTTFPMTVQQRTYVACLNCGEELPYNWHRMGVDKRAAAAPAKRQWISPRLKSFGRIVAGVSSGAVILLCLLALMEMPQ